MSSVGAYLEPVLGSIAQRTAGLGRTVRLDASVLNRSDAIELREPGAISANGSCHMVRASDGWLAVNLARDDDRAALPALLGVEDGDDACGMLTAHAALQSCDHLIKRAELLGLAISQVGERTSAAQACIVHAKPAAPRHSLRVIDLSALWAGPLCGSVFAALGGDVTKVESVERPDTTVSAMPPLDGRLNGGKHRIALSFKSAPDLAALQDTIANADVLITSARARALGALGLAPQALFSRNASLIWIAITGHGWESSRVAFGDDAAAAGGLVDWRDGAPNFIGDAIADPLTGLAAADAALAMLEQHQAGFIDAALARTAAYATSSLRVAA